MSTPDSSGVPEDPCEIIHLDLRAGAAELDNAAALRARVARQLGRAGLPEPDSPRFLVIDTPAGLTDHQKQYKLLVGYPAVGSVSLLVLLVGSAPGSYARDDEAFQPDRRLRRPAALRSSNTGLLWAGDLRSARTALEHPAPDDPEALAVLVDVLSVRSLYDEVLEKTCSLPEAAAAPGVRLLEQDLPPEVRDRAWRAALTRFAGEDTELPTDVMATASSGVDLPVALRDLVTARGGRDQPHRIRGGVADEAYRACADALDHAEEALAGLGSVPGLLRPARRASFETDVEQARQALGEYRELVDTALRSGGGSARSTADSTARFAALGLGVPAARGAAEPAHQARLAIGAGLKDFAVRLLEQGFSLRAVAQRFTGLAGRVEPLPGSALLPKLAALPQPPGRPPGDPSGAAAAVPGPPLAGLAAAGAGVLGALWCWPFLPLALVVPALFAAVAALGASRLRGSGRRGRWAVAPRVAALGGAVAAAGAAYATEPPVWLGTIGLLLGLALSAETARRLWRTAADAWGPGRVTAVLRRSLDSLDALLAEAVHEHWAVEERLYCADAARSVAGVLRATAAAAETEAVARPDERRAPDGGAPHVTGDVDAEGGWIDEPSTLKDTGGYDDEEADWTRMYAAGSDPFDDPEGEPAADGSWGAGPAGGRAGETRAPQDTESAPRWLDRENGEGGPDLVATLAGDLTDAALEALAPYWGSVTHDQGGTSAVGRTEERVRLLLSAARHHLSRNGVLAAPPFAAPRRVRPGSAGLLGTDPYRPARLVGAEADRQAVVQLSSPEQGALLDRNPGAGVWIRFAPRAVRAEIERAWEADGSGQPADVLWTSSGRYAGLVRLTPLRPEVVDSVRPQHGTPEPYGTRPTYETGPTYEAGPPYETRPSYEHDGGQYGTGGYGGEYGTGEYGTGEYGTDGHGYEGEGRR
ncbi:hypothetical protein ACFUCQ_20395 [Streptomyces sp. NPDC057197]|uniref:hypothetical protein n=1 Tax=Streptomyces sp. NPDC057197 TaxID=3346045 RepID=UPI00363099A3